MNYSNFAKALKQSEALLILTHKNPDGDTVGSASALCSALNRLGKEAYLYPNPEIGDKLRAYSERFFAPEGYKHKTVVTVDIATEELFPLGFKGEADLCVDHHPTNSRYAKQSLIGQKRSSCGEIVLGLIKELGRGVTPEEADMLYIALSTDTGCFQYGNTNAESFSAAAELVRLGANNWDINSRFFRKISRGRMLLEGMIYSGMEFYKDGTVSVATVTLDMLERSGVTEDDLDDLAGLAGKAEGSVVNITVRQKEPNRCKISVRSTQVVSSSAICSYFGGGGHDMAAGCTIDAEPERAKEFILAAVDEVYK